MLAQCDAGEKLGHSIDYCFLRYGEVENGNSIGVTDLHTCYCLAAEALYGSLVLCEARVHHLERDGQFELNVRGPVYCSRSAPSYLLFNQVFVIDQFTEE